MFCIYHSLEQSVYQALILATRLPQPPRRRLPFVQALDRAYIMSEAAWRGGRLAAAAALLEGWPGLAREAAAVARLRDAEAGLASKDRVTVTASAAVLLAAAPEGSGLARARSPRAAARRSLARLDRRHRRRGRRPGRGRGQRRRLAPGGRRGARGGRRDGVVLALRALAAGAPPTLPCSPTWPAPRRLRVLEKTLIIPPPPHAALPGLSQSWASRAARRAGRARRLARRGGRAPPRPRR